MAVIEVTAKVNAGTHPDYGPIVKGQTYRIDEHRYADQLFERPSEDWLAPWERDKKADKPAGKAAKKRS